MWSVNSWIPGITPCRHKSANTAAVSHIIWNSSLFKEHGAHGSFLTVWCFVCQRQCQTKGCIVLVYFCKDDSFYNR